MSLTEYRRSRRLVATLSALARAVLCAAVWVSALGIATAQSGYRMVEVAPADAERVNAALFSSAAVDIDPTGTYVAGYASPSSWERQAYLWSGGTAIWIGKRAEL